MPCFVECDVLDLFPLTNGNGCAYNGNTNAHMLRRIAMERNVEEALILFDDLTEEEKQAFLAYLREQKKNEGAA